MITKAPFQCGQYTLCIERPLVMGILNATPDSFSDGGHYYQHDNAIAHALAMVADGADIIDIGGESTRPDADVVSEQEELDRVIPIVESLAKQISIPISVDTSRASVMRAAIAAGASMINDVRAFQQQGAVAAVKDADVGLCIMHMLAEPKMMQQNPVYDDLVQDIYQYLQQRAQVLIDSGIAKQRICIDPGFGFGKTKEHNVTLLRNLDAFSQLGMPLLIGTSRKSFIGSILDKPVNQRLYGSLTSIVWAMMKGATILRVHDVAATHDAVMMTSALMHEG